MLTVNFPVTTDEIRSFGWLVICLLHFANDAWWASSSFISIHPSIRLVGSAIIGRRMLSDARARWSCARRAPLFTSRRYNYLGLYQVATWHSSGMAYNWNRHYGSPAAARTLPVGEAKVLPTARLMQILPPSHIVTHSKYLKFGQIYITK